MPLFGSPNVEKLRAKGNVKGLVKALDYVKGQDVRVAAARALGEIGDKEAVEPLIAALGDKDGAVRQAAAEALAGIGTPAVEPLTHALVAKDENARSRAAEALDQLAWRPGDDTEKARYLVAKQDWDELARLGERAVGPLLQIVSARKERIRKPIEETLVQIGEQSVEPLIQALGEARSVVRLVAARALAEIGDARAVRPMIQALKPCSSVVALDDQIEMAKALAKMGEQAVEPLIEALKDEDGFVRLGAADALGKIRDSRAVEPLIWVMEESGEILGPRKDQTTGESLLVLKDESVGSLGFRINIRPAAALALGEIGDARAVEPLTQVLRGKDPKVRTAAVQALAKMGATEPLVHALEDETIATTAAKALVRTGDVRGALHFVTSVTSDRATLIELASKVGEPAVEPLIEALGSDNPHVRIAATAALGAIGADASSAVPALVQALGDEQGGVSMSAADALGKIGPKAMTAVPHLIQTMGEGSVGLVFLRKAAWNALKAITGEDLIRDVPTWQEWWAERVREMGCPQCEREAKPGRNFCSSCGARLK